MTKVADLRDGLMTLTESRVVFAERSPDDYLLIRRNFIELRRLVIDNFGLELVQHPDFYRLEKLLERPGAAMTLQGLSEPGDFTLLAATLTYVETLGSSQPFLLSELVETVNGMLRQPLDWTKFDHRRALVRVLKVMVNLNLLERIDGDLAGYQSNEQEVLLSGTSYASFFLARGVENLADYSSWHEAVAQRPVLTTSQRVRQQLLFTPGICRTPETAADFTYMRNQRGALTSFFERYTVYTFELTRNVAMLVLPERRIGFGQVPDGSSGDDLLVAVGRQLRQQALPQDEFGQIHQTSSQWEALVGSLFSESRELMASNYRAMSPAELSRQLQARALALGMIRQRGGDLVITPLFGRLNGQYAVRGTKK